MTSAGTLILSPHSDDVALSTAGMLSRLPFPVSFVTIFSRSNYTAHDGFTEQEELITNIRRGEDMAFARRFDLARHDLGLREIGLRSCETLSEVFADIKNWPELTRVDFDSHGAQVAVALFDCIEVTHPSLIVAPSAIGLHRDHLLVRCLAVKLAKDRDLPLALFEDLPYAAKWSDDQIRGWIAQLGLNLRPRLFTDRDFIERKREALSLYPSQLNPELVTSTLRYAKRWHPPSERLWIDLQAQRIFD